MKPQIRHAVTAVILLLWSATFAMGASVRVTPPSGTGKFTIQGEGMDGVSGFDLIVSYDGSLSSPSVTQGSLVSGGAMFIANPNFSPNTIKIAVISPRALSSSGSIATITFARGSGSVRIASQNMIDSGGASVSGSITSDKPGIPFSESTTTSPPSSSTNQPVTTQSTTTQTAGSSTATALGTVNIAPDAFLKNETKPSEKADTHIDQAAESASTATAAASPAEQPEVAKLEEPKKAEELKFTSYSGVLERFRIYQGEKSPAILAALLKKEIAPTIRQEPPVALSDGKTNVTIIATLPSADGKSPNFALNGAKLVSLKKDEESNKWIIETLPLEKALKVSLTIQNGNEVIEFPLTVAPALGDIDASEAGFSSFLKNKTADLNGDGRHDYIDDFIYTANYLAHMDKVKPGGKAKP